MKHLLEDEKVISISATVIIHVLLILLFLWITVDFNPEISEFVEVAFSAGFEGSVAAATPETPSTTQPREASSETPPAVRQTPVELPQRRESQLPEQEILETVAPEPEKTFQPGTQERLISPTALPEMPPAPTTTAPAPVTKQEKPLPRGLFKKSETSRPLSGGEKVTREVARNFEINWEGEIQREIYQMHLPEFPPDVQREAIIKIKFTVLPDGTIGSAILMQKGDTRLENLTLEAFKTWRFNALPPSVAQVPQTGIITFRFKLK